MKIEVPAHLPASPDCLRIDASTTVGARACRFPLGSGIPESEWPTFHILARDEDTVRTVQEEATDPDVPWKTVKGFGYETTRERNVNNEKFSERFFVHFVTGWDGLTLGNLGAVLESFVKQPDGKRVPLRITGDPKAPVPFTPEWREQIALRSNGRFRLWVLNEAQDSLAFHQAQQEGAAKN